MTERKWQQITVYFSDNTSVNLSRRDFDKLEEISPVLDALQRVKKMKWELDRLLGEAEG